jgi:acyl-CoA synthetase (NDP forming)
VDLSRLFHPRSIAVVGATDHGDAYGSQTLLNLAAVGFSGSVWGVNPGRTEAHGVACFPSLADLPGVPDAVVVAIPAAGVPAVIEEAGALGCGGAVVYAAGFREANGPAPDAASARGGASNGATLEAELRAAAVRHALPVCGPNCDGLIALHSRAALWGDALVPQEPGHVALVSQSGNLAVNALATRRGLRLHTAISSGNQTVLATPDYLEHLAAEPEVRSVALLLEDDGDGARLCEGLAACADAGVGVAVLKVGASAVGAAAAAAHTGAVAGDHRVFRALVEEAGAAWASDPHDLLELAKALAVRGARPRGRGIAILTCSGGDSGLGADEAERLGLRLPVFAPATAAALRERLPATATIANPLDYTAMIWGDREWQRDLVALVGADPGIDQVLVFYDHPPGLDGASAASWQAVEDGILDGARATSAAVLVTSTLPELLDDAAAWRFAEAGVPALAGLRTGLACAAALQAPPADAARLREIAAACRGTRAAASAPTRGLAAAPAAAGPPPARPGEASPVCDLPPPDLATAGDAGPLDDAPGPGRWLAEHETKALLRAAGIPVVDGRLVAGEDDAVAALAELGGPVAVKRSSPALRHKTQAGALALDVAAEPDVRAAYRALDNGSGAVLVERMASPGVELIVAVRRDPVVPVLVVGLGGLHAEGLDDVAVIPLPATPARVEAALAGLRGAALLRSTDHAAAARLAAALTQLPGLELIECNPVLVHAQGAVVVDASAKEIAT